MLQVRSSKTRQRLSKVYVKVYGRSEKGAVSFYKDGYTDLRGKFDFGSLNTTKLRRLVELSILIYSKKHGAVIRKTAPPKM